MQWSYRTELHGLCRGGQTTACELRPTVLLMHFNMRWWVLELLQQMTWEKHWVVRKYLAYLLFTSIFCSLYFWLMFAALLLVPLFEFLVWSIMCFVSCCFHHYHMFVTSSGLVWFYVNTALCLMSYSTFGYIRLIHLFNKATYLLDFPWMII